MRARRSSIRSFAVDRLIGQSHTRAVKRPRINDSAALRDIHDARSKLWTEGKQLVRDGALIEIDADAVIAS